MAGGYGDYMTELLEPLGGVSRRRMFGGLGFWRDGLMFAIVVGDTLYFKADGETIPLYEAEGCEPFSYDTKTGRTTITSYWRVPERLFDDPEEFTVFARAATSAALRADAKKAAKAAPASRRKK